MRRGGTTTDRQVIPATNLPAFGRKRFEIPLDAEGKAWVRFAVWEAAGNSAAAQPITLRPIPLAEPSQTAIK